MLERLLQSFAQQVFGISTDDSVAGLLLRLGGADYDLQIAYEYSKYLTRPQQKDYEYLSLISIYPPQTLTAKMADRKCFHGNYGMECRDERGL